MFNLTLKGCDVEVTKKYVLNFGNFNKSAHTILNIKIKKIIVFFFFNLRVALLLEMTITPLC